MLNRNALFLNTILLGGTTAQKLEAVADAGFAQAELWQQDVQETGGGYGRDPAPPQFAGYLIDGLPGTAGF
ncbi:hypothetical protein [Tatumella terrea]|uniref:Uncharacterized protein n=1 Tax=Tatumella terrea TaxID=419007 RepID=A0ABW1VX95_9GAMM